MIVDVLTFSTAAVTAVARGALVYLHRCKDETVAEYAKLKRAFLAEKGAKVCTRSPSILCLTVQQVAELCCPHLTTQAFVDKVTRLL